MSTTKPDSPIVLVVHDSAPACPVLSGVLAAGDVRVAEAPSGFAAHEIALRVVPDAVLITTSVAGAELTLLVEQFRTDLATRNLPIIVMTEARHRIIQERLLEVGASEVVLHTADAPSVLEIVRRWTRVTPAVRALRDLRRRLVETRERARAAHVEAVEARTRAAALFMRIQESKAVMLAADSTGELIAVNDAACRLSGYAATELLGRHVWEFAPASLRQQTVELWRRLLAAGFVNQPWTMQRKDGAAVGIDLAAIAHVVPDVHVGSIEPIV